MRPVPARQPCAHSIPQTTSTVKPENLGEDEDEDHADEQARLLRGPAHAGVADDADREAGRKTREADGQAGAELDEAREERHARVDCGGVSAHSLSSSGARKVSTHGCPG
jgi:hypothetical protein